MKKRISAIYEALYTGVKSKQFFAERFNVTTKTVENTIAKTEGDILYDRKLGGYRFATLLPKFIPHDLLVALLQDSISNETAKQDFITISRILKEREEAHLSMIPTEVISSLTQKLIMLEVAIRSNCILKVNYAGNEKPMETKYIRPHKINTSENSYYLYGSYDGKNLKNVGEYRSFAIDSMHNITAVEWIPESVGGKEGRPSFMGSARGKIGNFHHSGSLRNEIVYGIRIEWYQHDKTAIEILDQFLQQRHFANKGGGLFMGENGQSVVDCVLVMQRFDKKHPDITKKIKNAELLRISEITDLMLVFSQVTKK